MLSNVTSMHQASHTGMATAQVMAQEGAWFDVACAGQRTWVKKAFSCAIRPRPDDQVLVVFAEGGEGHVLSILERPGESQACELEFPGDVSLKAANGSVDIHAGSDVCLASARRVQALSPTFAVRSDQAQLNTRSLEVSGEQAKVRFQRGRFQVHYLESVADTAMHCARTVVRKVEGIETFNVGSLIKTVRDTLTIRSRQAVISSRHDMKIDAERIHMG